VLTVDEYSRMLVAYFSQRTPRMELDQWLEKRGIDNPHHFLNNLTHYLTTGQSLAVYDQNSEYLYGIISLSCLSGLFDRIIEQILVNKRKNEGNSKKG
jgi:hypothetical protein